MVAQKTERDGVQWNIYNYESMVWDERTEDGRGFQIVGAALLHNNSYTGLQ